MKRYCESFIYQDLSKKMVFIGGPRQVGKTTLSKAFCHDQFQKGFILIGIMMKIEDAILQKAMAD